MGVLRALQGFQGSIGQPTAQVIDGSVRFDGNNQYLSRSFGSGNRKKWKFSFWLKIGAMNNFGQGCGNKYGTL